MNRLSHRLRAWRAPAPSLQRLALWAAAAYALLFVVSPLKSSFESASAVSVGHAMARALYDAAWLENPATRPRRQALFVALGLAPVVGLYLLQIRAALRGDLRTPVRLPTVLGFALVYALPLALIPRMLSSDVFSYVVYGRLSAVYHANPLTVAPQLHADAYLDHVWYRPFRFVVSAYGPVWLGLSHLLTRCVETLGGALWAYELAYKSVAVACHLGTAALVWFALGRMRPAQQLVGTIAYAWNPLMLAETAWNAHNDALVALLLLGAIAAHAARRTTLAVGLVALSVPVKWITALALPFFLVAHARRGGLGRAAPRRLLGGAALAVAIIAASFVPFWDGARTLTALRDAPSNHVTTNSLGDLLVYELRWAQYFREHPEVHSRIAPKDGPALPGATPDSVGSTLFEPMIEGWTKTHRFDWSRKPPRPFDGLERALRLLGLCATALVGARALARQRDEPDGLARAWFWTCFVYLTAAALWFWPWYLLWLLPVAVLLPWGQPARLAVLFSLTASQVYFGGLWGRWGYIYRALLTFVPPLAYLAFDAYRSQRARGRRIGATSPRAREPSEDGAERAERVASV